MNTHPDFEELFVFATCGGYLVGLAWLVWDYEVSSGGVADADDTN